MRNNLNTTLLIVAILLLAYIAFLKPQPQRFTKTSNFRILVDTATGRLCDARTPPSKQTIKNAQWDIKKLQALPPGAKPDWFSKISPTWERKTALREAELYLSRLLHPRTPYCSDL